EIAGQHHVAVVGDIGFAVRRREALGIRWMSPHHREQQNGSALQHGDCPQPSVERTVGSDIAAEFTLTLRSNVIVSPSKRHTTVSRKAVSANCQTISNVSGAVHRPPATTTIESG